MKNVKKVIIIALLSVLLASCASLFPTSYSDLTPSTDWYLGHYIDTRKPYVGYEVSGTFSNSATIGSIMTAQVFIDKNSMFFKFIEYNRSPASEFTGQYYTLYAYRGNTQVLKTKIHVSGSIFSFGKNVYKELRKGGVIDFVVTGGKYVNSTYCFTVDATGCAFAVQTYLGKK